MSVTKQGLEFSKIVIYLKKLRKTVKKSTFYGESASPCDAGISEVQDLVPLTLPKKFPVLFNQCVLGNQGLFSAVHRTRPQKKLCHLKRVFLQVSN
jgi:hypothetical protein